VAELSVDGWQLNKDAVMMQSQRLMPSIPPETVEQCHPGIGTSPQQANDGQHVVAALHHGKLFMPLTTWASAFNTHCGLLDFIVLLCLAGKNTHTHNRFTALLEYVRDHPGEQVPER